jgi:AcrR family transcriptional regulator
VTSATTARERRIEEILRASIPVFAARGYHKTSMAHIADAAAVSRPALYQYFTDRADLFAAAFRLLLEEAADAALDALAAPAPLADQLDGYLQRLSGDGYATLAATEFGDELLEARHQFAADAANNAMKRAHGGLRARLASTPADRPTRTGVFELLTLSTAGLKQDHPTPAAYRRRLTFLAQVTARTLLWPHDDDPATEAPGTGPRRHHPPA